MEKHQPIRRPLIDMSMRLTRRQFLVLCGIVVSSAVCAITGCQSSGPDGSEVNGLTITNEIPPNIKYPEGDMPPWLFTGNDNKAQIIPSVPHQAYLTGVTNQPGVFSIPDHHMHIEGEEVVLESTIENNRVFFKWVSLTGKQEYKYGSEVDVVPHNE